MQRHFIGLVLVFATATAFGEDVTAPPAASTPAAASAASTATSPAATTTAVTTSADKPKLNNYNGYKLVKKEGQEDKYCRKQKVLGSRTKVIETCLTLEEITVLRESGQGVVYDSMRNQGTSVQGVNTGNGSQPSAVSF